MAKTTRDTPEPKRGLKHALKPHVRHRPLRLLRLTGWLKGARWAGKGVAGAEGEANEPVDAEVVRRAMVKKN